MTPRVDLWLPIDGMIPFLPWTSLVYMSFYVMLPLAAWWGKPRDYLGALGAVLCANAVCWLFFLAVPSHYPRPSLEGVEPAWAASVLESMWKTDRPGNTFPSIHVATSLLVALRLRTVRGGAGWLVWAGLIAVSTLTVKQHFLVDVVGGVLLALATNALFFAPTPRAASVEAEVPAPPGGLNIGLALGILALMVGAQWLASRAQTPWALAGCTVAFAFLMLPAYSLVHEAEHGVFHARHGVNEAFGTLLATMFPGPFTFLRMCHLGHHARNRSPAERFELIEPGDAKGRKWATFFFLYLGGFWLLVPLASLAFVFWPKLMRGRLLAEEKSAAAMLHGVPDAFARRIRLEALATVVVHVAATWAFGWTWWLLYAAAGLNWSAQQYVTHAHSPLEVLGGAHNLRASRLYEAFLLHFNWHLAHHQHPKVPWLYLPAWDDATRVRPGYLRAFLRFWKGPVLARQQERELSGR